MTTFTLIAYRPNYSSYDHYNDSSNSDLEIKVSESLDEIVKHTVDYEFNKKSSKYDYCYDDWQLTLLIDGKEESWDEEDEINVQHMKLRELYDSNVEEGIILRKQEIIEEHKRAKEQRLVQLEQKRIAAEEERLRNIQKLAEEEKALFLKLKEKYKDM